jgi:hypothetical protein
MLLDALTDAGNRITSAIRSASQTTGTSFDYLLKTAARESALNPNAKASTSTARGLYQFIESTWLATLKEEGPRYGLGQYADAIERTPNGRYVVRDPSERAKILKLRENPAISAVMAGAFAGRNSAELKSVIGREPTSGELYVAHFLGAGGAKRLLSLHARQPGASAAAVFPEAARANRSIFYARDGSERSAAEVYGLLTAPHDRKQTAPPMAVASLQAQPMASPALPVGVPAASAAVPTTIAALQNAPASSPAVGARLQAASASVPTAAQRADPARPAVPVSSALAAVEAPVFHALFREGNGALSPAVRELWSGIDPTSRRLAVVASASNPSTNAARPPLDLTGFVKPAIGQSGRRTGLGT